MPTSNAGRTEKLSARVCRELETAILDDRLSPTSRLPAENELCRTFGVSRTVIREALQQLSARGIVHSIAGSGSYVAASNLADLERCLTLLSKLHADQRAFLELLDLRLLVETEMAGRLASSPNPVTLRALRAALARMRATVGDSDAFARADYSFHLAIVDGVGHGLFAAIWKPLAPLAHSYGRATYDSKATFQTVIRQHRAILLSIASGDVEGAREAARHHLTHSREHYLELTQDRARENAPSR